MPPLAAVSFVNQFDSLGVSVSSFGSSFLVPQIQVVTKMLAAEKQSLIICWIKDKLTGSPTSTANSFARVEWNTSEANQAGGELQ